MVQAFFCTRVHAAATCAIMGWEGGVLFRPLVHPRDGVLGWVAICPRASNAVLFDPAPGALPLAEALVDEQGARLSCVIETGPPSVVPHDADDDALLVPAHEALGCPRVGPTWGWRSPVGTDDEAPLLLQVGHTLVELPLCHDAPPGDHTFRRKRQVPRLRWDRALIEVGTLEIQLWAVVSPPPGRLLVLLSDQVVVAATTDEGTPCVPPALLEHLPEQARLVWAAGPQDGAGLREAVGADPAVARTATGR